MTRNHDPFGVEKKLSDPNGNYLQRPMERNTRRQNSAAGAGTGGALYGTVGAAVGGAVGRRHAKAGVRALRSIGAAPSRARTAGIVTGHSLRTAGKAGAAFGAAGAVYGGALGAVMPHRKDNKKLPFGRVRKNDGDPFGIAKSAARMGEQAAEWAGHLPKHTAGAVAANKSAFHASIEMPGHLRPVKPGLRIKRPQLVPNVAKSAFGVEHEVVVEKKKIGHILPGGKVPPAVAKEPKVFKVRRAGDAPGRGAQGQRRVVRQGRV